MEPEYLTVIKSNTTQTTFSHTLDENKIKNNRKEIRQVCWRHLDGDAASVDPFPQLYL